MNAGVIKVLLTEDETVFADLIQTMLAKSETAQYEVDWVKDLKTCLAALSQKNFDIVILDLHLPDSLGLDTIASVRKRDPNVPIVAMTGGKEEALAHDALNAGAQEFFEKLELNPKMLVRIIQYAIDRRTLEIRLERHAEELETRVRERTRQIQAAKVQWEKTFDAVPDLISIIDEDHRIIRANWAMAKAVGTTPGALVGRSCHEIMHGTDAPIANCPHARTLQDGIEHIRDLHEPALGMDLFISTTPLLDDDGQLLGSVHVARDISAIKEAQRAIAESESQHRMFMDRLPDPTVVYDNRGRVVFSNAAFEQVFGWSTDELANKRINFVPPDCLPATLEKIGQMKRGEPVVDFHTERFTKEGGRLKILLNTAPLFDTEGNQTGNIVILRDITAIRRAEAAQKSSERRFRELVETMNEGLTMGDVKGRIVYTNADFCRMLGYEPGQLAGKYFVDLLDGNSRQIFTERWGKRLTGDEKKYEVVFTKKDGGLVFAIISPRILRDSDGEMVGAFAVVTDITERKNLESQLIQAQKLEGIGQLAAGIAHEINTPTQYVSSNTGFLVDAFNDLAELTSAYMDFLSSLEEKGLEKEEVGRLRELARELDYDFISQEIPNALKANREGLDRIAKIVLSIKEFAHPGQEDKQPADLNKAVQNTITVARNEWKYVAEVETDLDPELPPVPCVVGEINQVTLNLIVNAAHAIAGGIKGSEEEKGLIRITTRAGDGYAEINIADNGPGIPAEIRNRIFDPFFTTKEPGKGTGQGLAIAYKAIVDNHNGEITVDSSEGGGTTFTIRLPLDEEGVE